MSSGLPRPSECRSCHDPIRFVNLVNGKSIPVNPLPATEGRGAIAARLVMTTGGKQIRGFFMTATRRPDHNNPLRFTPHQATCSALVRSAPAPAPAPADVPLF